MNNRSVSKPLSSLTLIIAGTTAAVAGSAADAPFVDDTDVSAATAIRGDLDSLRMAEFVSPQLGVSAEGHHSDSIGSHHHHDSDRSGTLTAGATRVSQRFSV